MFSREKLFGNSLCQVPCWFAGVVTIQAAGQRRPELKSLAITDIYLSRFWRLGKSKVRVLTNSVSGESMIPVRKGEGAVWAPFIRALFPLIQAVHL